MEFYELALFYTVVCVHSFLEGRGGTEGLPETFLKYTIVIIIIFCLTEVSFRFFRIPSLIEERKRKLLVSVKHAAQVDIIKLQMIFKYFPCKIFVKADEW